MTRTQQNKLVLWLFIIAVLTIAAALVLYALRQNISLFYTPSQIAAGEATFNQRIRLGGMVVKNSIIKSKKSLAVQFDLTDFNHTVHVSYNGLLPDLFREGQGIVASGRLTDNGHFKADEVLAKHDANYMPPEVKAALNDC